MADVEKIDQIRAEVSRVHESAMYSQQTQFEYSKTWRRVDRLLGGAAAILAAAAGAGGLSDVMSARWAGIIALAAAGAGAVATTLGAPTSKDRAATSATAYLALQQDARILLNVDLDGMTAGDAREKLAELVARQQQLNASAEVPSNRAWKKAKANIEKHRSQAYEVDRTSEVSGSTSDG